MIFSAFDIEHPMRVLLNLPRYIYYNILIMLACERSN